MQRVASLIRRRMSAYVTASLLLVVYGSLTLVDSNA